MIIKRLFLLFLIVSVTACGTKRKAVYTTPKPIETKKEPKVVIQEPQEEKEKEILESTSTTQVYADVVNGYINQYKEIAQKQMKEYGIPASIILAQGILESGAGRGELVLKANNHFGIKCHGWNGESVHHDDDAKGECFRKYKYSESSYQDHSLFLTGRSRYAFLFNLSKDDYKGWSNGLRKAGYATDPKYPQKLIGLIERYNLNEFDAEVLGKNPKVYEDQEPDTDPKVDKEVKEAIISVIASNTYSEYRVVKGDTLYSISRRHNLTVDELKEINNLANNDIHEGQVLYVKPL